jgi:prepilin-type N-terminal cleavage/methylation domain-containing protein
VKNRAFTLIELLVVISVIGLLSSIVMASLNSAREKGRMAAARQFEGNVYRVAAEQAVGIWDFDECTGTFAADRSGTGNNGVLTNMATSSWSADTPNGIGCSLFFDGTNDFVNVGNAPSLRDISAGSFSIAAWMKTSDTSGRGALVGTYSGAGPAINFEIYLTGRMRYYHQGSSVTDDFQSTKSTLRDGSWHHVVMVRDTSTGRASLYVDGALDGQSTITAGDGSVSVANVFYIGSDSRVTVDITHSGYIDGVRIFSKALTAAEIGAVYAVEGNLQKPIASGQ